MSNSSDYEVLDEARKRYKRCIDWEASFRSLFLDDIKFANADPDNGWQWDNKLKSQRDTDKRPCLTINKVRQHNLQIINDAKQNKTSISIHPMGNQASYESAQVFEGICRHIEVQSQATNAYDHATKTQVQGGVGYWRVVTDYAGDDTFDQEIYIRRVKDPLSVLLDPDMKETEGSDARFGFIFDDMAKDLFEDRYPKWKNIIGTSTMGFNDDWITKEHIRVCEYFRKVETEDRLIVLANGQTVKASHVPNEMLELSHKFGDEQGIDGGHLKERKIRGEEVEWYLIAGDHIIDKKIIPGKFIPIVRLVGEEIVIQGKLDRKGHTRPLKDGQRMLNYWFSAGVEHVALQSKTPYIAPKRAVEGVETYWSTANQVNHSYLPYNDIDEQGNPIAAPTRQDPPVFAPAYVQGMQLAKEEMLQGSGQFDENFGKPTNAISGVAIQERQRQGDNATYHFIDNQARAIRFTGRIIVNLVPIVYDTPRILRILAEDGQSSTVHIDPNAAQSYQQTVNQKTQEVQHIFNPKVGDYEVECDVGPNYASQRQEAFSALSQIMAKDPELMKVAGDILFQAADFPLADKLTERFRKILPPEITGQGPTQAQKQAQEMLQKMQGALTKALGELAEAKRKEREHAVERDVDVFNAKTQRLKAVSEIKGQRHERMAEVIRLLHEMDADQRTMDQADRTQDAAEDQFTQQLNQPQPQARTA